ncbi:MAG TPA: DUF5984 family protein [Chloroflexota bacterium]
MRTTDSATTRTKAQIQVLVNFKLRPTTEIEPWLGADGLRTLHWFGLTLGWYWLDLRETEFFRYDDTIQAHWAQSPDNQANSPYVEYQVARLHEDLMRMLPKVVEAVPAALATRLHLSERWDHWLGRAEAWMLSQAEDDRTAWDLYYQATGWWGERLLTTLGLAHPPRLWIWRADESVYLRWDNRKARIDGIPVWQAAAGEVSMPVNTFMAEVASFHTRFMEAMQARIEELRVHWPRADIRPDTESIEQEHTRRAALFPGSGSSPLAVTDWDAVQSAMNTIDAEIS